MEKLKFRQVGYTEQDHTFVISTSWNLIHFLTLKSKSFTLALSTLTFTSQKNKMKEELYSHMPFPQVSLWETKTRAQAMH